MKIMRKEWQSKDVSLESLILWDENVRFDEGLFGANNKEIINFLFKNEYKMMELVELFVKQGEIPQDEKILVIPEKGKYYKVLDGNRRVSVMSVLNNPQILEKNTDKRRIENLRKSYNHKEPYTSIEVLIAPNEAEARKVVDRRHYSIGFLSHGAVEKDRSLYKEGTLSNSDAFALQYFEKMLEHVDGENRKKLKAGYSTVKRLFGLISTDDINTVLHVTFEDGVFKQVRGKTPLYKKTRDTIIYEIIEQKLNTRTINTAKDARQYLNTLPGISIPKGKRQDIIKKSPKKIERKDERFGAIRFFSKETGCEKIRDLYTQIRGLKESDDVVINICIGHLLECSIKELFRETGEYRENQYLDKLFTKTKDLIRKNKKDEKFKGAFPNTPYNIDRLQEMQFHTMWNKLRHDPKKTSTSFNTRRIRELAFEIVQEIDKFLYENTT